MFKCKCGRSYSKRIVCVYCGSSPEKIAASNKKIGVFSEVRIPSPEHPLVPYYVAFVDGGKSLLKLDEAPVYGSEVTEHSDNNSAGIFDKNIFKEKVVVVTGASSGIGKEIARLFGKHGAHVVANYLTNEDSALSLKKELDADGVKCFLVKADVADESDNKKIYACVLKEFGRLDFLINNAGVTCDKLFSNLSLADWQKVFQINVVGSFLTTSTLLPLLSRRGRIINIASIVGLDGNTGQTNYAASKAALIGFTKSLSKELASKEITVNAIAPGFTNTPMTEKMSSSAKKQVCSRIPLGRMAQVDEIANVVLFFCSPAASYITGSVMRVDGGFSV